MSIDEITVPPPSKDARGYLGIVGAVCFSGLALVAALFPATPPLAASSDLEVREQVIDLGTVGVGDVISTKFELHNRSTRNNLMIDEVRPSCGCTVPKLSKGEIPPGLSEPLKVFFRVPDEPGVQRKSIFVNYRVFEGAEVETLRLEIKATIVRPITVDPEELTFACSQGNKESDEVVRTCEIRMPVTSSRTETVTPPLRVIDVKSSHTAFHPEFHKTNTGWNIEVRFRPDEWLSSRKSESLLVQVANDEESPRFVRIPMIISSPSPTGVSP